MSRIAWGAPVIALVLAGCAGTGPEVTHAFTSQSGTPDPAPRATAAAPSVSGSARGPSAAPARPAASRIPHGPSGNGASPTAVPMSSAGAPGRFPRTADGTLDAKVVLVDPGHNGGNAGAPSIINRLIWNGRESETCDTTGTQTDSGYTEAQFNWNVALYLTADLRAEGATVVLTRTSNTGVGPCVTRRAALGNDAHAELLDYIQTDGGQAASG